MKTSLVLLLPASAAYQAFAFVVPYSATAFRRPGVSKIYSNPPDDTESSEEQGLDLNLEEMFDMFDAADKDETFDDAVKKIKKDE